MKKKRDLKKLWQSMVNLDLTPDEFIRLQILCKIRNQSIRQLVSNILRDEMKTFKDLIENYEKANTMLPSLGGISAPKRTVGRPRNIDQGFFKKSVQEASLPISIEQIIEDSEKNL